MEGGREGRREGGREGRREGGEGGEGRGGGGEKREGRGERREGGERDECSCTCTISNNTMGQVYMGVGLAG